PESTFRPCRMRPGISSFDPRSRPRDRSEAPRIRRRRPLVERRPVAYQKSTRNANCSSRGPFRVAVTTPNVVELNVVPGVLKAAVLFRLNASARNCNRYFSLIANERSTEKSTRQSPGAFTLGSVLDTFPYV